MGGFFLFSGFSVSLDVVDGDKDVGGVSGLLEVGKLGGITFVPELNVKELFAITLAVFAAEKSMIDGAVSVSKVLLVFLPSSSSKEGTTSQDKRSVT